jgi:hypothetical protein
MRKRYGAIIFMAIVLVYALLQIATSKRPCEADCQLLADIRDELVHTHNYDNILNIARCPYNTDTLCVYSNYRSGTNWAQIADTICAVAARHGISQAHVFILKTGDYPYDTLAKTHCP